MQKVHLVGLFIELVTMHSTYNVKFGNSLVSPTDMRFFVSKTT